jgi:hypothetical protein
MFIGAIVSFLVAACGNTTPNDLKADEAKATPVFKNSDIAKDRQSSDRARELGVEGNSNARASLKIVKTQKGEFEFGLARIRTTGVKTVWVNNGDAPIYGVSYLFIEKGAMGKSLRRKDISRRVILSCEVNKKVIVLPGEKFETLDMLDDRAKKYEVALQEINPPASWHEMTKNDCDGKPISIIYRSL